jgi:hypothetical protein
MKTFKKLSIDVVRYTMFIMTDLNKTVTTLEVKNKLREMGYYAEQNEVKLFMNDIYNDTLLYVRANSDNYRYFIYSFKDNLTYSQTVDIDDNDNIIVDNMNDNDNDIFNSDMNDLIKLNHKEAKIDEVVEIMYTTNGVYHFRNNNTDKENFWVVNDYGQNEFHIYDENLSRDNVRSLYAKSTNTPFIDVRSRKLKNFL